jgi:hypothetical protein
MHFTAVLIQSVFKIPSLYELKRRSMYGKLLLTDGRAQVGITLGDVGETASLLYRCVTSAISRGTAQVTAPL